jgi:chromosome partitioning protein
MAGIVVVASQKGGCGKTTLSVHLAGRLREMDPTRPLLVVDADPQEQAFKWLADAAPEVHVERVDDADVMLRSLPQWGFEKDADADHEEDQPTRVIVDVAGGDGELQRAAMLRADVVVIPCSGSLLDLGSASNTWGMVQLVRDIRNNDDGRPVCLFSPSRMTRTVVAVDVMDCLDQFEETVVEPTIPQRASIADAAGQSKFVWDLPSRCDAADIMRAHCDAILERIVPQKG